LITVLSQASEGKLHRACIKTKFFNQETLMNKDQVKGRIDEVKGKVKEAAGVLLDDKDLEIEGSVEKNVGKVQSGFGDLKQDINKATED